MTVHQCDNWNRLVGLSVEIRHKGDTVRTGIVEDAMPDDSALWLASDGAEPRTMFEAALGHQVWVECRELTGTDRFRMTDPELFFNDLGTDSDGPLRPSAGDG
ncbi:hypothetical protein ACFQ36_04930 [Arthrobacter sp. GCM10027362]|uniref:hypothetical protein n=1 Tax=Arthrobacter sp. GCM10027362 TaxID=3273379 RepID=UPI0036348B0A